MSLAAGIAAAAVTGCGSSDSDDSLSRSQIHAAEAVVRALISSNAVPGVTYSIGNTKRTLAAGAFGSRLL